MPSHRRNGGVNGERKGRSTVGLLTDEGESSKLTLQSAVGGDAVEAVESFGKLRGVKADGLLEGLQLSLNVRNEVQLKRESHLWELNATLLATKAKALYGRLASLHLIVCFKKLLSLNIS